MSPWFLWNVYHFGTIRQISGITLPNIAHNMYLMKYGTYMSLQFVRTEIYNLKIWIENIVRFSGGFPLFIFALVAWAHLRGIPANVPEATGAAGPRVLGSWTPPNRGPSA